MPSIEKHIELSLKRTGKEYRKKIHEWMEEILAIEKELQATESLMFQDFCS